MRAMVLDRPGEPLRAADLPRPEPGRGEIVIDVRASAICRTDLHVVDGELAHPKLPLVPGHQIVGTVAARGRGAHRFEIGARVGVPWLSRTCGECDFCRSGRENLCDRAIFTGYTRDGGYAEAVSADERFVFPIPDGFADVAAAPLLCAGMIGFRALCMAGTPEKATRLGFYGFGAAAHLLAPVAIARRQRVFAFTRPGDGAAQSFARRLGCFWAGGSDERPPEPLDAAILFAPVGALVPVALAAVQKGGTVVCAGIHMSEIPAFSYDLLWGERVVRSVANLTRRDGEEFLPLAASIPLAPEVNVYPLERANDALADLRAGRFTGSAVLVP